MPNNSKNPSTAVLLAAYNGIDFIQQQIESILSQRSVNIHIYISIDKSSDGTEDLVTSLSQSTPNIHILKTNHHFGSAASNFFHLLINVNFSSFDYISLSDQDDIWDTDKIINAIKLVKKGNYDAYSGNVTAFWPNDRYKLIKKSQKQRHSDYMFESAGPGCTFVLTRPLALDLQDFLLKNQNRIQKVDLHDWFIYAFARSRGYIWHIDHESHMLYRQHNSNVFGANAGIKAKIIRWKKLRSGWLTNQAITIAEILNYDHYSPIKQLKIYSLLDRSFLILNINKFRRRFRDRIALLLLFLLPPP
jgi:rhamnosyltransferase